ncbi:AraC family transcriptional regulator [Allorhizocola rhizosphaerae]|uniref:AraC family transcriptional regulator n=1 Tax=Allorhizocola rhizosphaerae TaxID=1872709 RepID=UPI000E3CED24|nr:AraC family transcriptional regulator [Allorhizocola rhizosphaerae]
MDILSDVLAATSLGGGISGRLIARAPWGLRNDTSEAACFHIVVRGSCWLRVEDGTDPVQLRQGDVTLLPHSGPYFVGDEPGRVGEPFAGMPGRHDGSRTITLGGSGAETVVVCGAYDFGAGLSHPLLRALPRVVHLPAAHGGALEAAVGLVTAELDAPSPGTRDITRRLVDVLLVYILRTWHGRHGNDMAGWFGALHDPQIGKALTLIHQAPERRWTVAQLAGEAGLSRAAFARRFAALAGEPPLTYLTRWRMTTAALLLRDSTEPLSVIADRVGYDSEFAFARTFRRTHGQPPGRYRADARARR